MILEIDGKKIKFDSSDFTPNKAIYLKANGMIYAPKKLIPASSRNYFFLTALNEDYTSFQ